MFIQVSFDGSAGTQYTTRGLFNLKLSLEIWKSCLDLEIGLIILFLSLVINIVKVCTKEKITVQRTKCVCVANVFYSHNSLK